LYTANEDHRQIVAVKTERKHKKSYSRKPEPKQHEAEAKQKDLHLLQP